MRTARWIVAIGIFNLVLVYLVLVRGQTHLHDKGNLIENIQAMCYAIAIPMLVFLSYRTSGIIPWLSGIFALTCLSILLREIHMEDMQVPELIKLLGSGTERNLILGGSYLFLFSLFFFLYGFPCAQLLKLLKSEIAAMVIAGVICYLIASIFDHMKIYFWEEILEMNGSLLILWAAIKFFQSPESLTRYTDETIVRRKRT